MIITQSHVAVHILEFLACLARMPGLYVHFSYDEYKTIFTICFRYLQYVRDQPVKENKDTTARSSYPHARNSLAATDHSQAESNFQPNTSDELPQYVYALAYHVVIFWFLSLKLSERAGHVSWIAKYLVSVDANGKEKIDEQAQVTLDFMQRSAYADVDESAADPTFTKERFGDILKRRWIVGHSIVTIEQATRGGWAQITKRQPSGTSCYIIREKFNRPPAHQEQVPHDHSRESRPADANVVLPSHLLLQLSASVPQSGVMGRPIALPSEPAVDRAIAGFDRNFTVDGHKVGVIYIGENQTNEVEILSNIMGSSDYTNFLSGLGTLTKLQGANFNTQGLDRTSNIDGEYAFCWRDRVTEIVFHVTTQMPTDLERDPQCIGKKRHIGNDFVNIIFNNSGLPFRFDTFPSEFNYVNIVITPESRASFVATRTRSEESIKNAFYKVQVMSKPGFPEISPAAETKIMSLAALPGFIRLLALNASVFSLVWANKQGGEHVSSWRNRLRDINRLRERYKPKPSSASTPTSPPGTSNGSLHEARNVRDSISSIRRSSVANFITNNNVGSEPSSQRSSVLSTAETEVGPGGTESMVETLDFSAWA
ncbi:putative Tuberous sclerosis 2 protein like protein [Glarea lozoyensis 74030]|nr:putative Tuberous sclerosis 2 protein like protein [Glarea lozoyensis 74030]